MADVTELFSATESLVVRFPTGIAVTVVYRRDAVRTNLVDPNSKDPNVLAEALCTVIESWDLSRAGEPIPLAADAVAGAVNVAVQQYIFKAILKDQDVDPK